MTDELKYPLTGNGPIDVEDKRIYEKEMLDRVTLICHIRKTPLVLYGIFVELVRQFYSDKNNLPLDTCVHWDPDPDKSSIWIDSEYRWEDEAIEMRPAIYVHLGNISYTPMAYRRDGQVDMDLEQGEYKYLRRGAGSVSWVHVGRQKGETVTLAGATMDYLDAFTTAIRQDFNFETFQIKGIQPLSLGEKESKERYRSLVAATFTFQDTWTTKLESQKLKAITFKTGQNLILRDNIGLIG